MTLIGMHELHGQMHPNYFVGSCRPTHPSHPMISSTTSVLRYRAFKTLVAKQMYMYICTCTVHVHVHVHVHVCLYMYSSKCTCTLETHEPANFSLLNTTQQHELTFGLLLPSASRICFLDEGQFAREFEAAPQPTSGFLLRGGTFL